MITTFSNQPAAIIRVLDPHSPMPDDQRSYLRQRGVKKVLIIPFASRGQANGRLTFRLLKSAIFIRKRSNCESFGSPSQLGHSAYSIGPGCQTSCYSGSAKSVGSPDSRFIST
jgi:hypothetical protein